MRIERLAVSAYGRISAWERDFHDITAILGENEAGKSTVRDLVVSLLYGFDPASESQHPYVPWEGDGRIRFEAQLRLDDGRRVSVGRRLLATPQGTQTVIGGRGRAPQKDELRNRPLSATGRVSRDMYRAAFTVGAPDLRMFAKDAWSAIEAEFLGDAESGGLRRASEVLKGLRDDANALWRADRRTQSRSGLLESRARDLEKDLRDARARDDRRHAAEAELAEAERELVRLEERRKRTAARAARLERLQRVATRLEEWERLRQRAGDPGLLAGLPADPAARLQQLRDEASALSGRVESLRTRRDAASARAALPEAEAAVLEKAGAIQAALAEAARLKDLREEAVRAEEARRQAEAVLREAAAQVLTPSRDWSEEAVRALEAAVAAVPQAELDARAREADKARGELEDRDRALRSQRLALQQAAATGAFRRAPGVAAASGLTAMLRGLAGLGAGMLVAGTVLAGLAGQAWGWVMALGGTGVAVVAWAALRSLREGLATGTGETEDPLAGLAAEVAEASDIASRRAEAVRELLAGVPVTPARLADPDADLARSVADLRRALGAWSETGRRLRERREAVRTVESAVFALAGELGLPPAAPTDAAHVAHLLKRRLDEALAARDAAVAARQERDHLEGDLRTALPECLRLEGQLREFLNRLAAFDPDPDRACLEVQERLRAHRRAQELAGELDAEAGGLESARRAVEAAVAAGDLPWTDEDRLQAERDVDDAVRLLTETGRHQERLRKELEDLARLPRADDLAGEMAACREEAARLRRERDRLALLAAVVRLADQRFREEHRPDILRRAGEHLAAFTGGRYDDVDFADPPVDEADRKRVREAQPETPGNHGPVLVVRGGGAPDLRPVAPPLSQGTLHQIHLAMRLALADHLDDGQERLPVCLDETFVHWDGTRRSAGLAHLRDWARERQVLLFTCHPWLADEAARLAGAKVVNI